MTDTPSTDIDLTAPTNGAVTAPVVQPTPPATPAEPEFTPAQIDWFTAEEQWKADVEAWLAAELDNTLDADWKHERLVFKGDNLAVRTPGQNALTAMQFAGSKSTPPEEQLDTTVAFFRRHLGPESYAHVTDRMMDPDQDYSIRDLAQAISAPAVEKLTAEAESSE